MTKMKELKQAEARVQELNREASELPEKIRDASKRAAKEKAEAARAGGALLAVAADSEITELQARQASLPFERWAADLLLAELQAEVQGEIEADAGPAVQEARAALRGAQQRAEEARAAEAEALSNLTRAERRQEIARRYRKDAEKRAAQLEEAYPGVE